MIKYCKVSECRYPVSHVTVYHYCGKCKKQGHGNLECGNNLKINNLTQYYKYRLPNYENCVFGECITDDIRTHTTESHTCTICYDRLHSSITCPLNTQNINIKCPICRTNNTSFIKIFDSEDKCSICLNNVEIFLPDCGHNCLCLKCSKKLNEKNSQYEIYDESILDIKKYNISLIKSYLQDYPSYVVILKGMGHCTIVRRLNKSSELEGIFIHTDDIYDPNHSKFNREFMDGYCKIENTNLNI